MRGVWTLQSFNPQTTFSIRSLLCHRVEIMQEDKIPPSWVCVFMSSLDRLICSKKWGTPDYLMGSERKWASSKRQNMPCFCFFVFFSRPVRVISANHKMKTSTSWKNLLLKLLHQCSTTSPQVSPGQGCRLSDFPGGAGAGKACRGEGGLALHHVKPPPPCTGHLERPAKSSGSIALREASPPCFLGRGKGLPCTMRGPC